jgi:hypothetical protein
MNTPHYVAVQLGGGRGCATGTGAGPRDLRLWCWGDWVMGPMGWCAKGGKVDARCCICV